MGQALLHQRPVRLMRFSTLSFAALLLLLASCSDDPAAFPWGSVPSDTDAVGRGDLGASADAEPPDEDSSVLDAGAGADAVPTDTGSGQIAVGAACSCDDQCAADAAHAGLCVNGICMQTVDGECAEAGSAAECGAGLRCWGEICYPDCDAFTCAGECDEDGSCIWTAESTCDDSCSAVCQSPHNGDPCPENAHESEDGCACDDGYEPNADGSACVEAGGSSGECPPNSSPGEEDGLCYCDAGFVVNEAETACVRECEVDTDCEGDYICVENACEAPPCTAGSCPAGLFCSDSGDCVVDLGTMPPGPIPNCDHVADYACTGGASTCGSTGQFLPVEGPGYWNYPLNGETSDNQYRSFCRTDLMMLVKYAAAQVDCLTEGWGFGNHEPIGLGDMSEENGDIPGTSIGEPGHPEGTHVGGTDMDIAYYQIGTSDNRLRPICEHTEGGVDQYHCTEAPDSLDVWRSALFIAFFHDSPQLRVIGVDGQAGPLLDSAITQLCDAGWYSGAACRSSQMTYETVNEGRGWYGFHHHHLHVSIDTGGAKLIRPLPAGAVRSLPVDGCGAAHSVR